MSRLRFGFAAVALCLVTSVARAQESSPRLVASKEFQRGIALAKSGDLAAAVDAFQSAYRTSPHYATLYNLAQAYAGLGKPVEAAETLERFLKEGDSKIDPERRREVEALLARQKEQVGVLELTVTPEGSEVFVDGKSIGSGPVPERLLLEAGHHVLAVRKSSYVPRLESLELAGQQTVRLTLALETLALERGAASLGLLRIGCDLPGVEVSVDGERGGETPLDRALVVPAGQRDVRFARAGYRTYQTSVAVPQARVAEASCAMTPDLAGVKPGRLRVSASEPYARVLVDGSDYRGSALPPGPHLVSVHRSGYRPWSRVIALEPAASFDIVAQLEPTAEHRAELEARARKQRTLAAGFGAAGIVLGGVSAGLFVWNNGRYDDFAADPASFDASRAASVQRVDDLAVVTAVTGAAALVTAGVLWFTSD